MFSPLLKNNKQAKQTENGRVRWGAAYTAPSFK